MKKAKIEVGFLEWNKLKQTEISKNTGRTKGDKTMRFSKHLPAAELSEIVLKDFEQYQSHVYCDYVSKSFIL